MKMIHMTLPQWEDASLEGYILDCKLPYGQETARPAVIVIPGGGYVYCSDAEAEPVALRYTSAGFHAFILRYSVGFRASQMRPLHQISWVIGYLRENAAQWNIDPEKIVVCGFSAGGHLALHSGLAAEHRPNAMILGYPATSAPSWPGFDFMLKLLTGKQTVNAEDEKDFDLVPMIGRDAPPVFMMATAEDALTPFGALAVAKKYSDLGRNYELHIFQYGPHGLSLADVTSAEGSIRKLDTAFAQWHDLSVQWLHKTFGAPEFVDKNTSRMAAILKDMGIEMKGF